MLRAYVLNVSRMLRMFYLDVSNVDLGIAHVTMAIHACFKRMFQVFYLFQTYVANVLFGCFKSTSSVAHVAIAIHVCFKRMLVFQLFHTYIASILFECFKSRCWRSTSFCC
jgi:hypothetical protein